MPYITVVPAYGRDYKSKAAAVADWDADKDFQVQDIGAGQDNGRYTNKSDLARFRPGTTVSIRYKQLTMVANVPPERKKP
jgi:hypothetical protein